MQTSPSIWLVLKIMFFSTIGTVGLLLLILAIPVAILFIFRNIKK